MNTLKVLFTTILAISPIRQAQAAEVNELVVEALIDGDSEFHVRPDTVWWESGKASKPGKWDGQDEPTYLNGTPWKPRWHDPSPRGADKSAPYSSSLKTTDLEFELLAVTSQQGGAGIEKRTPATAKLEGGHFVVRIPDPEPGGRWYKFVVRKKKKWVLREHSTPRVGTAKRSHS